MSKVRVYEVAKQLNLDPKTVVGLFQSLGITEVRNQLSSVEADAVDRIKRHLEKQKSFDVVEERIRPTVVKRRAVAKPKDAASSTSLAQPSTADLGDGPSVRDVSVAAAESAPALPPPAPSSRALHQPSTRDVAAAARSTRDVSVEAPVEPVAAAPESRKSVREVAPPAPESAPAERRSKPQLAKKSVRDVEAVAEAEAPQSAPRPSVAEAPAPEPAHVEAPAEVAPMFEAPAPEPVTAAEPAASPVAASPAARSLPPKTGVEYWTGRPGVPMPVPANAQRTGIGGGAIGAMPRRVQYDPRSGGGAAGARGPNRGGPLQRGPMGRMSGLRRGGFGVPPGQRRTTAVSTQEMSAHKKVIRIEENITLSAMAQKMSLKATELLMKLLSMGMTGININSSLDADTAKILASEFGWEVEDVAVSEEASIALARGEASEAEVITDEHLELRSPVVTIMGHVDHGKTSLLDKIRKANVAGGEAGGITQHIGAYKVRSSHGETVFLDTPGHEAFTAMRARGASVTDIVILVVAGDDGVMPQTKEAVAHARAAKVPIIVAVNKMDKPGADLDRVRRELVEIGLQPEEWGGDTIFVPVSAHTGEGIDQLLEMIAIQSEVLDLKANPDKPAAGAVIEALLDRGRGPVARILVQEGTLKVGDYVLAGAAFGKVRAMTNEHGKQIHAAGPSTPVEVLGLSDVPSAGDQVHAVKDAKKAQEIADSRKGKMAKSLIPATAKVSLEELSKRIQDANAQELRVIIKGDVQGSVEAVSEALAKLSTERVRLAIIHAGVGAVTEGDVNLAIASKAIVIGFNVRPAGKAASFAEENGIEIRTYSIIYNAIDDVKSAMEGLLPATLVEKRLGEAEVRAIFKIRGIVVAGCYVTDGQIKRVAHARVRRGDQVVWEGKFAGLKRIKEDVKDVAEGFECGITLDGFTDFVELDRIECFDIEEVKQKL